MTPAYQSTHRSSPGWRRPLVLGVVALTVSTGALEATVLGRREVSCPVCGQKFRAVVLATIDTSAGVDRDLFARSAGPQPVFYRIATCPRCYYSGYLEDFQADIRLPKAFRDQVLKSPKLDPGMVITPETDQRMIPAEVRYRLAHQCYQWRGMSDESMAWLYLRSSWVSRDLGSVLPRTDRLQRVMGFVERWLPSDREVPNQVDRELQLVTRLAAELAEGHFTRYQVPYVRFVLAMIWRRHGENALFESLYPPGRDNTDLPERLRSRLEEVRASIAEERRWQQRALVYFLRALDGREIQPSNQPAAKYLIAELYRRLGQPNRALHYYDRALADPRIDARLAQWAREQRVQVMSTSSH